MSNRFNYRRSTLATERVLGLRASNAAGPHPHKNTKRLKTRETRKEQALQEYRDYAKLS